MKRIIILCLSLALLLACGITPFVLRHSGAQLAAALDEHLQKLNALCQQLPPEHPLSGLRINYEEQERGWFQQRGEFICHQGLADPLGLKATLRHGLNAVTATVDLTPAALKLRTLWAEMNDLSEDAVFSDEPFQAIFNFTLAPGRFIGALRLNLPYESGYAQSHAPQYASDPASTAGTEDTPGTKSTQSTDKAKSTDKTPSPANLISDAGGAFNLRVNLRHQSGLADYLTVNLSDLRVQEGLLAKLELKTHLVNPQDEELSGQNEDLEVHAAGLCDADGAALLDELSFTLRPASAASAASEDAPAAPAALALSTALPQFGSLEAQAKLSPFRTGWLYTLLHDPERFINTLKTSQLEFSDLKVNAAARYRDDDGTALDFKAQLQGQVSLDDELLPRDGTLGLEIGEAGSYARSLLSDPALSPYLTHEGELWRSRLTLRDGALLANDEPQAPAADAP